MKHRQSTLVGIGNGINVYSAVSNAHLHFTFIDSSSEAEKVIKFITGDGMMMMVAVVARKLTDRQTGNSDEFYLDVVCRCCRTLSQLTRTAALFLCQEVLQLIRQI